MSDKVDIEDAVAKELMKKIRNKKKKLEKIKTAEQKIKSKEIKPTEEVKEMIAGKEALLQSLNELEAVAKNAGVNTKQ